MNYYGKGKVEAFKKRPDLWEKFKGLQPHQWERLEYFLERVKGSSFTVPNEEERKGEPVSLEDVNNAFRTMLANGTLPSWQELDAINEKAAKQMNRESWQEIEREMFFSDKDLFEPLQNKNPFFDFPEGITEYKEPYVTSGKRILCLYDVHIPYHNKRSLATAVQFGIDNKADTVILAGDFADVKAMGRWAKTIEEQDFSGELTSVRLGLEYLRKAFPSAEIIWLEGNHEFRLVSDLLLKAPQLHNLVTMPKLTDCEKYGVQWVADKRLIYAGELNIAHGHEIPSGGKYKANTARVKGQDNIMFGHHHKTQEDYGKNLRGNVMGGWQVGCLCDLAPAYNPRAEWNHGFAFVTVNNDGTFEVQNKKIIDGKVY